MAAFELAVVLAIAGVAAFPCWRHSAEWGYLPSASAGILLIMVIAAVSSERTPSHNARAAAQAPVLYATAD
ncbi:MAG: DUF3309 family protein [Alphaproteobacteria bacterium]|nr:DUF3309 family protein [Alphaproteobacteria bacterium]